VTAELFDPATGNFSATGDMTVPRALHSATLLQDGRVLILWGSGGSTTDPLATAEIYDPATGTFTATGPMTTGRGGHVAARLPDGRVMVTAGDVPLGQDTPTDLLVTAEVWDPATGTWSALEVPTQPKATNPPKTPKPTKMPK
jgi:hypothetical protein